MAPTDYSSFFLTEQTQENCRFISRDSHRFEIITTRDACSGDVRAVVLRTVGTKRDVFLSATGATFPAAIEELHSKSADATQQYIKLNGYGIAPKLKGRRASKNSHSYEGSDTSDSDDPINVTVAEDDSSSSSGEDLDESSTAPYVVGKGPKANGPKHGTNHKSSNARRSRSISRSPSRSRSRSRSKSLDVPIKAPVNHRRMGFPAPPPYPPGMNVGPRPPSFPPPRPAQHAPPPPPHYRSGPPMRVSPMSSPMSYVLDMILHIRWPSLSSELSTVVRCSSTKSAIEHQAMQCIRNNKSSFQGVTPAEWSSFPWTMNGVEVWRTVVVGVVMGDDGPMLDLKNAGENLGRLLGSHNIIKGLPKVEVEISKAPVSPQPIMVGGGTGSLRPSVGKMVIDVDE